MAFKKPSKKLVFYIVLLFIVSCLVTNAIAKDDDDSTLDIKDSKNKTYKVDMKIYQGAELVYDADNEIHYVKLKKNEKYNITIEPENSSIIKIKIEDAEIADKKIDKFIRIEDLNTRSFVKKYSIDPDVKDLKFKYAEITAIASGKKLFKCVDWNFTTQNCYGRWKRIKSLKPGQEYKFKINKTDPGFIESNETVIVLDVDDYLINSKQTISNDTEMNIKIIPTEIINDTIEKISIKGFNNSFGDELKITDDVGGNVSYVINPTNMSFTNMSVTIRANLNSRWLYKCADWNFTTQICPPKISSCTDEDNKTLRQCNITGGWAKVDKLIPGEQYYFIIAPGDPAYAEYNSTFGAPYCESPISPCIVNSTLLLSTNSWATSEPNQPNTIDICVDGGGGTYQSDESVENITIESLNNTNITQGDTVRVNVSFWCSDEVNDVINVIYTNNASNPSWAVKNSTSGCAAFGFDSISVEIVLDNIVGDHAIRILEGFSITSSDTCAAGTTNDHDDVVFVVQSSSAPVISIPKITLLAPVIGAVSTSGVVNFTYNVTDPNNVVTSCSLYINDTLYFTDNSIVESTTQFFYTNVFSGVREWNVSCSSSGGTGSTIRDITILDALYEDTFVSAGGLTPGTPNTAPWERGNASDSPILGCFDDAFCWATNLTGDYVDAKYSDYLIQTTTINLSGYTDAYLSFWHYRYFEDVSDIYDGGVVNANCSGSWERIIPENNYTGNQSNNADSDIYNQNVYGLHGSDWELEVFDISHCVGNESVTVQFQFSTDSGTSDKGWFIDKMRIGGAQPIVYGRLNVSLDYPVSDIITSVAQNRTFYVNATVKCLDGDCGIVHGNSRYNVTTGGGIWWNESWEKRNELSIINNGDSLTNFPVFVNVTYSSNMQADYDDLRFVNGSCGSVGSEVMDVEVENYTTSRAIVWVRVPTLGSGTTNICMYYNNTNAVNGENVTVVWNNNYQMVQHMNDDPTNQRVNDSTSNEWNGTKTSAGQPAQVAGIIGNAQDFDGTNYIVVKDGCVLSDITAPFSIGFWMNPDSYTQYVRLFIQGPDACDLNSWLVVMDGSSNIQMGVGDGIGQITSQVKPASAPSTGTWTYVTWTFDGTVHTVYIDGANSTAVGDEGSIGLIGNHQIGARDGGNQYTGLLDELFYSNVTLTPDWINQTYQLVENQNSIISWSGEESNTNVVEQRIISTVPGTIPVYTISGQPISCGNMVNDSSCTLSWQVNATGIIGSHHLIDINVSSDTVEVLTNNSNNATINITEPIYGWLNITLNNPSILLSTNVTENRTFIVNATINCLEGECGEVFTNSRYNISSPTMEIINATVDGVPFYTSSGQPLNCGQMLNNSVCNAVWIVNATGNINTTWLVDVNVSSSVVAENNSDDSNIMIIERIHGWLDLVLITPKPDEHTHVRQNFTFPIRAIVTCRDGECGNVIGNSNYNTSGDIMNIINTTVGGVPFYTSSAQPYDCEYMFNLSECTLEWTVNATGALNTTWKINVNITSDFIDGNITDNATVEIVLNNLPTQDNPILNSTYGTNLFNENLTCYNQSTDDGNNDEIKNIYSWYKNSTPDTVLYLPFEACEGNASTMNSNWTRDYSGYNNHGNVDGPTFSSTGGYDNWGVYTFVVDDVIEVPNDPTLYLSNDGFTVMAWIYPTSFGQLNFGRIVTKVNAGSTNGWLFFVSDVGSPTEGIRLFNYDDSSDAYSDDNAITLNEWQHVAVTFKNNIVTFYINGVNLTADQTISNFVFNTVDPLYIGNNAVLDRDFVGKIDEVKIYNYSLSSEQVIAIYQNKSDMIMSQETTVGDLWQCTVSPNDRTGCGDINVSNIINIVDTTCTPQIYSLWTVLCEENCNWTTSMNIQNDVILKNNGIVTLNSTMNFTNPPGQRIFSYPSCEFRVGIGGTIIA